jgi:hypothetical protein
VPLRRMRVVVDAIRSEISANTSSVPRLGEAGRVPLFQAMKSRPALSAKERRRFAPACVISGKHQPVASGKYLRTLARSSRGLNGLAMYPSQPAARALASSPLKA